MVHEGELYSEKYKRRFTTEKVGFQVVKDPTDKTKLVLAINRKPIVGWLKVQFDKLKQNYTTPHAIATKKQEYEVINI